MQSKIITGELVSATLSQRKTKFDSSIYSNIVIVSDDGLVHKLDHLIVEDDLVELFQVGDYISLSYTERKGRAVNIATAIKNRETLALSKSRPFIGKGPLTLAVFMTFMTIASVIFEPIISPIAGFYMIAMFGVIFYTYKMEQAAQAGRVFMKNLNVIQ